MYLGYDEHSHIERVKSQRKFETTMKRMTQIGIHNLELACGKNVTMESTSGHHHLACGLPALKLASMTFTMLGNDKFTEVYFTTASGNIYCIVRLSTWSLISGRENAKRGKNPVKGYEFADGELDRAQLRVGQEFRYGEGGNTVAVKAILAVNASRAYFQPQSDEFKTDIRREFKRMIGVI